MPTFDIVVYRHRVERTIIKVRAKSQYDAMNTALEKVEENPDQDWTLLDPRARWFCGDNNFDNEPYCLDKKPRIFHEDGTSTDIDLFS